MSVNQTSIHRGNATESPSFEISSGPIYNAVQEKVFEVFVYPFSLIIIYIVVGLIGNGVVFYVFSFKWRRNKNTVFILTLALLDLFSCTVNMPVEGAILYNYINFNFEILCKISRFTSYIVSASYSCVLVAIAIDRYIMVCRPFQGMTLGIPYAKRACIGAIVFAVLTQWPSLVFYGTYRFKKSLSGIGMNDTYIEANTCLVSNYYVEHSTYLYAFYAFLFIGHVIIFVIFISVYMIIGRNLFLASHVSINETRPKSRLWRMSLVSAFTGVIPRSNLCSRGSRTMSAENVYTHARRPIEKRGRKHGRHSDSETDNVRSVYTIENGHTNNHIVTTNDNLDHVNETDLGDIQITENVPANSGKNNFRRRSSLDNLNSRLKNGRRHSATARDYDSLKCDIPKRNSARDSLKLNIGLNFGDINESDPRYSKTSSSSAGSERPLLTFASVSPPSTSTPDSARPLLIRRSQSEDFSNRLRICSCDTRKLSGDIKEISLKQNTLIMRMVTFCYMLSYLPFLVLVSVRYNNPDIPGKLTGPSLIVYHIFLRSYFFNSVIRPFIYIFMNAEYRHIVWHMIRCKPF